MSTPGQDSRQTLPEGEIALAKPRARDPKPKVIQLPMNTQGLIDTARMMVASDKGLLAMDESNPTCNKRFAKLGIPQTVEARRAYRS